MDNWVPSLFFALIMSVLMFRWREAQIWKYALPFLAAAVLQVQLNLPAPWLLLPFVLMLFWSRLPLSLKIWSFVIVFFSGASGGAKGWDGWFSWFGLTPDQALTAVWLLRKGVHIAYYGIMAGLAYRTMPNALGFALLWVLAHSGFDELRQLITDGRSGSAQDIGFDFAGAILALVILKNSRWNKSGAQSAKESERT